MDILLFFQKSSKALNDSHNKLRESILTLAFSEDNHVNDPIYGDKWRFIKDQLLQLITSFPDYDPHYEFIHKGGMGYNYDFLLKFEHSEHKIEFKYSPTLTKCPQFLELFDKDMLLYDMTKTSYAEFYYHNFLDHYLALDQFEPKPDLDTYLKNVRDIKYKHPFFNSLYKKKGDKTKQKSTIASNSIKSYLLSRFPGFKLQKIFQKIKESQQGKVFVCCEKGKFNIVKLDIKNMKILKTVYKKDQMTFDIITQNFIYDIRVRLNWGNNNGISNPRWKFTFINK
jgi:hypothetical protein